MLSVGITYDKKCKHNTKEGPRENCTHMNKSATEHSHYWHLNYHASDVYLFMITPCSLHAVQANSI